MQIYAIAAVSQNGIIGNQGKIPWHFPLDFRWFKHMTLGGVLFMGRKTYDSIGKPLPGRTTYLLTRQTGRESLPANVVLCHDWKSAAESLADSGKSIWVCGGGEIYRELLPHCCQLFLTRVKQEVRGDAHFPEIPSSFQCDQVIHENDSFRVERWVNQSLSDGELRPDVWPFEN